MNAAGRNEPDPDAVTTANVDLSNCDREQIHIPGAIQPHGAMLVLSARDLRILQASANIGALLGTPPAAALLGQGVAAALGEAQAGALRDRLAREDEATLEAGPVHALRAALPNGAFDAFAHRTDGAVVLELEPASGEPGRLLDLNSDLRVAVARLQAAGGLREFLDRAVRRIRAFTGYDRVLAYKFLEDGSGDVVAEDKAEGLEPYLGLRYPASDIPAPSRRLFALSWLRHLPDAQYEPVPLLPEPNPETGRPLDMSRARLRSVSTMYSGYLTNMGVRGSTVMPLMKSGRLWGLVSCMHHAGPKHLSYETRLAAEFLAHTLSLLLAAKEDADTYEYRLRSAAAINKLVRGMAGEAVFHHALTAGDPNLLSCVEAGGAALLVEGGLVLMGRTPDEGQVRALTGWLAARGVDEPVFATDSLPALWPEAEAFEDTAAGVLAIRLVRHRSDFALWFRPKVAQTVLWAGDPAKPVAASEEDGEIRLSPRGSFALYSQSVRGRSEPWREIEVEAAGDLRRAVVEVILRQAEALERTNRELAQSNLELDSFAYVASHDLKEPLRGIHNYAGLLLRSHGDRLGEDGRARLDTVLRLTRRMDDLIDGLLHYARVGRIDLALDETDLDELLDEVLADLKPAIDAAGTAIRRTRPLPTVRCDRIRVREVFSNLAANALRYTDKPRGERWIEFRWEDGMAGGPPVFVVRDNGIGIAAEHQDRIFQIFRRLNARNEFGDGSGVGLTIVRRMVERHGGRVWMESVPGEGTAFSFTLARDAGNGPARA